MTCSQVIHLPKMVKLYFFCLVAVLVSVSLLITAIETRLDSACEMSPVMDMKKPPRFGKRSQSLKDIFPFPRNLQMASFKNGLARRSANAVPLLCLWPSVQRRNPSLVFDNSAENFVRGNMGNTNPEQRLEN